MRPSLTRFFRSIGSKLFKLEGSPRHIAGGYALGTVIGMLPLPAFKFLIAIALAACVRLNKKAACVAVFNVNPFTAVFIFSFNYWLGKNLLGIRSDFAFPEQLDSVFFRSLLAEGRNALLALTFGGLLSGAVLATCFYFLLLYLLKKRAQPAPPANPDAA